MKQEDRRYAWGEGMRNVLESKLLAGDANHLLDTHNVLGVLPYFIKTIVKAEITESDYTENRQEGVRLTFMDGSVLEVVDDARACCESRYVVCDDNPEDLVGGRLTRVEVVHVGNVPDPDDGGVREEALLVIDTDKDTLTLTTRNDNNGYYGGFDVRLAYFVPVSLQETEGTLFDGLNNVELP